MYKKMEIGITYITMKYLVYITSLDKYVRVHIHIIYIYTPTHVEGRR